MCEYELISARFLIQSEEFLSFSISKSEDKNVILILDDDQTIRGNVAKSITTIKRLAAGYIPLFPIEIEMTFYVDGKTHRYVGRCEGGYFVNQKLFDATGLIDMRNKSTITILDAPAGLLNTIILLDLNSNAQINTLFKSLNNAYSESTIQQISDIMEAHEYINDPLIYDDDNGVYIVDDYSRSMISLYMAKDSVKTGLLLSYLISIASIATRIIVVDGLAGKMISSQQRGYFYDFFDDVLDFNLYNSILIAIDSPDSYSFDEIYLSKVDSLAVNTESVYPITNTKQTQNAENI